MGPLLHHVIDTGYRDPLNPRDDHPESRPDRCEYDNTRPQTCLCCEDAPVRTGGEFVSLEHQCQRFLYCTDCAWWLRKMSERNARWLRRMAA